MPSALRLTCDPIPQVRIGLVGLGGRGMKTLERYACIDGAAIVCIADLEQERVDEGNARLERSGRPRATAFAGSGAWREVCRHDGIDLIYICTEWSSHTVIAVEAMRQGKHVAVEVPAATTIGECRQLVRTAEQTRRHCFMTENCCYDLFSLQTLEMHRMGMFGEITHCEGAYVHNLHTTNPDPAKKSDTRHNWMVHSCATHGGNPYPTHGIGPIAQLLGIHRTDRFKSLVSVTSRGVEKNGALVGRGNTSLITTAKGITILLQLDVTTPRPYTRIQAVCGTEGFVQKYPVPTVQLGDAQPLTGEEALAAMSAYFTHPAIELWNEGQRKGVANPMNYAMDARLIYCLRQGLPLDMDVYDAAEWSCIAELSQQSASQGGKPVDFPDFFETTE